MSAPWAIAASVASLDAGDVVEVAGVVLDVADVRVDVAGAIAELDAGIDDRRDLEAADIARSTPVVESIAAAAPARKAISACFTS